MVNPQVGVPYFTVQLSVFDGDTVPKLVDRLRRISVVPGNLRMALSRYITEARSIPVIGDTSGTEVIGQSSKFTIVEGQLHCTDADNGLRSVAIGSKMQYSVTVQ